MKIKQYEIWIANLNPKIGTEAGKVRPVLIVQTDLLNQLHPSTIICPITAQVKSDSEVLRVHLKKSISGLKSDCDIMIDQIRAVDNRRLVKRVGILTPGLKEEVKQNLRITLDLF